MWMADELVEVRCGSVETRLELLLEYPFLRRASDVFDIYLLL